MVSEIEGVLWPIRLMLQIYEALACGTPVISCPRGALPEIVEHGKHGFLVPNVLEGVRAVQGLETISRTACQQRAERHFSGQVAVDRYESLYRDMVTL